MLPSHSNLRHGSRGLRFLSGHGAPRQQDRAVLQGACEEVGRRGVRLEARFLCFRRRGRIMEKRGLEEARSVSLDYQAGWK